VKSRQQCNITADNCIKNRSSRHTTNHIPTEVDKPEDDRLDTADKLKMPRARLVLLDEKHEEASWDLTHGKDDTDGNQRVDPTRPPAKQSYI